jgi:hypothetical protein
MDIGVCAVYFVVCAHSRLKNKHIFENGYDIIIKESKYPERDDGEWSVARLQVW